MKHFIIKSIVTAILGLLIMNIQAVTLDESPNVETQGSLSDSAPFLTHIEGPQVASINLAAKYYAYPEMNNVKEYHYIWKIMYSSGDSYTIHSNGNMCNVTFKKAGEYLLTCQLAVEVDGKLTYPSTYVGYAVTVK